MTLHTTSLFWTFIIQSLTELVEFMSDPYARCKDHQKLVRNLRVSSLHNGALTVDTLLLHSLHQCISSQNIIQDRGEAEAK